MKGIVSGTKKGLKKGSVKGTKKGFNKGVERTSGTYYDSDAQFYISYVNQAGGKVGPRIRRAINDFVRAGKTNGWWYELDAIYPFIGGTPQAHSYNLKNPTTYKALITGNQATNSWHSSLGIKNGGGGANSMWSPYNPRTNAVKLLQNDVGFGCYISSRTSVNSTFDMGADDFTGGTGAEMVATGYGGLMDNISYAVSYPQQATGPIASAGKTGLYLLRRTTSTNVEIWWKNSKVFNISLLSQLLPNNPMGLGNVMVSPTTSAAGTFNGWANMFFWGSSKIQDMNFYQDVQTLQLALGRAIF